MRLVIFSLFCLIISACWQQSEVISVEPGGTMKWLVVVQPDWEFATVKDTQADLNMYLKQMTSAGWDIKSKGKVVEGQKIVIALIGNLKQVGKSTDFYKLHSVGQSQAKIEFLCPMVDDYRVNRTVKFKDSSNSAITCSSGIVTLRY